jgi:hypothetical protein
MSMHKLARLAKVAFVAGVALAVAGTTTVPSVAQIADHVQGKDQLRFPAG